MTIRTDTSFVPAFTVGETWRARFAIGAGRAVDHWMAYVRQHRDNLAALKRESANILHGIREAANVPGAWSKAATLAVAFDPFMVGLGAWRHWADCLTALLNAPEATTHPVTQARLQHLMATLLARLGQVEAAVDQLKQALRPLREAQAWNPLADVLLAIAYWRAGAGQHEGIDVYLREAESLAMRLGNHPVLIDVHHVRGRQALQDGRHQDAIASFQQALDLAQETEHAPLEKAARNFLA
jgi:tetratricopeptide (TPR) repeat protein